MRGALRWLVGLVVALLAVLGLVVGVIFIGKGAGILPSTIDRSQPVLLQSVRDLEEFTAAEGNFQAVIDTEDDGGLLPDFLLNDRRVLIAGGTVRATVDFSALGNGAVDVVDDDTVRVRLPAPELSEPEMALDRSTVTEQRGLVNRLGDFIGPGGDNNKDLYELAQQKIATAAEQADLTDRAEANTTKTLEGLFRSLGYDDVEVSYEGGGDSR